MRRTDIALLIFLGCLALPVRGEPASSATAGEVPDQAVVLRVAENGRAQLTFVNAATGLTTFEFQHQGNLWTKAANLPVEKLLGLPVADDGQWQQVFGGPHPQTAADWSRFWNGWLDRLYQLKGDDRLNLPGGSGGMRAHTIGSFSACSPISTP